MSTKTGNEKDAYVAAKIFLVDVNIGISLIPDVRLSYRKSSSNGHPHFSHPVDVSASPTVAESKARFMREFGEENGSSLGLRDKKVRHNLHFVLKQCCHSWRDSVDVGSRFGRRGEFLCGQILCIGGD